MLKPNGIFINMKIGFCYFFSQISPSKMFTFSFFLSLKTPKYIKKTKEQN